MSFDENLHMDSLTFQLIDVSHICIYPRDVLEDITLSFNKSGRNVVKMGWLSESVWRDSVNDSGCV